jgi:hypothetical protein
MPSMQTGKICGKNYNPNYYSFMLTIDLSIQSNFNLRRTLNTVLTSHGNESLRIFQETTRLFSALFSGWLTLKKIPPHEATQYI